MKIELNEDFSSFMYKINDGTTVKIDYNDETKTLEINKITNGLPNSKLNHSKKIMDIMDKRNGNFNTISKFDYSIFGDDDDSFFGGKHLPEVESRVDIYKVYKDIYKEDIKELETKNFMIQKSNNFRTILDKANNIAKMYECGKQGTRCSDDEHKCCDKKREDSNKEKCTCEPVFELNKKNPNYYKLK